MLFYDPTESRQGTRLPLDVVSYGQALPGLEAETAADLLLSPSSLPVNDISTPAGKVKLQVHCRVGLLIQRKSGADITNFITDHTQIAAKMHKYARAYAPWLLMVGDYKATREGKLVVDGRTTNWDYNAYQAALEAWQYQSLPDAHFDGGGITILQRDDLVLPWLQRWETRLAQPLPDKMLMPRKPSQVLSVDGERNWRTTLMSFPGISVELATRIADYCGTLANSLVFISNPDHIALKADADWPEGIGPSVFAKAHHWLGLEIGDEVTEQLFICEETRWRKTKKPKVEPVPWEPELETPY
jgi:hypothetical protein